MHGVALITAVMQLGELQVGAVAGYGMSEPYRAGAGLVVGIAPGRLAYVGVRWTYHFGTTITEGAGTEVRNRSQVFATDLGLQVPLGDVEVIPSVSVGAVRFAQRSRIATADTATNSKAFFCGPGLALQWSAWRFALIAQVQYYFTGRPRLPRSIDNRSIVASVRIVFLSEVRRIRR